MDEKQIRKIARIIFQMMKEKEMVSDIDASALLIAYILLPERWREYGSDSLNDMIVSLGKKYQCILVLPEENDKDRFSQVINCNIVTHDDVAEPVPESLSFFPIPCRDLVSKTALCLSDDFNSHWVRRCIEKGTAVYMKKETALFTEKESPAYRNKVRAYYRDVESYGIHFLEELTPTLQKARDSEGRQNKTNKYITMSDLDGVDITKAFRMKQGDILTDLAKEYIEELGVQIIVE